MLRVHFNNGYTRDHQKFKESDKEVFVFTVVFQSIPKRATNQPQESLRKRFPWYLALVNKQMLACKFIEKDVYNRPFAFHPHFPKTYPNSYKHRRFTAQNMKFSIKDFFSKRDQIRILLRISPHLLKKSLMENFNFCAVLRNFQ